MSNVRDQSAFVAEVYLDRNQKWRIRLDEDMILGPYETPAQAGLEFIKYIEKYYPQSQPSIDIVKLPKTDSIEKCNCIWCKNTK